MKRNRMRGIMLAAAVLPTFGYRSTSSANTYFWNGAAGGSGNWDLVTKDWATSANGTLSYIWTNNGSEIGSFGTNGGVVTLTAGGITASNLIFSTGGYTLTGGPLTLTGTNGTNGGTISASGALTIASQIAGSVGLTKTGTGTLTLTGTNTYTGPTSVSNSYLIATADASGQPLSTGAMSLTLGGLRLNGINANTTTTIGDFTFNGLSATGTGGSNLIIDNSAGSGGGFSTTLAAGNLNRGSIGTVLGIVPVTGSLGTGEVITFANGNSLLTNGILPAWVAAQTSGSNSAVDFLGYGANGVTVANYSSTDLTTSTSSSVVNQSSVPTISGDVSAYALKTNQSIDLAGHTLTLGNGSGQTGLILNSGGQITNGSINFGSTEGIVYVQSNGTIGSSGSTISSSGLTVAGSGNPASLLVDGNYVNASGNNPITNTVATPGTTLTFGATAGASKMTLSGTAPVLFSSLSGTTMVINDVMQDPAGGSGSVEYAGNSQSAAIAQINAVNTYTGPTMLNGNSIVQFTTDSNAAGTAGPFGAGMIIGNSSANTYFQPLGGGTRVLANPMQILNGGFTVASAPGDTTNILFTGPMTFASNSTRTLQNNLAAGVTWTIGSSTTPSTITLSDTAGATLTLNTGTSGNWIINDVIQNGASANGLAISGTGSVTLAAQNTYTGGTTVGAAGSSATILIPISSNALPGASFTSGPFGTGSITIANNANQNLRPIGGNREISNAVLMNLGMAMDNAPGDTSNLTIAGPITTGGTARTITNGDASGTSGGAFIIGDPSAPSTWTLATGTGASQVTALGGPVVINDVIQDSFGTTNGMNLNPNSGDVNTITLNGANAYVGKTSIGSNYANMGAILLGVSSNALPGSGFTSGPFGTGSVVLNNPTSTVTLTPIGGDRTVSNAITMTSGLTATNSAAAPYNLLLAGPITTGSTSVPINDNILAGQSLQLGSLVAPSTIALNTQLSIQTSLAAGSVGSLVVNDALQNGTLTGSLLVQNNAIVQLNVANNYTGGTTVNAATLTTATNFTNGTLAIGSGGLAKVSAQLTAGATAGVTSVPALSIDPAGKLDLTNNGLIVQGNTSFSTVQADVISGAAGNFTGNGITSSLAAADALHSTIVGKTAVGYATDAELGNPGSFLGVSITDSNSSLVRFTLAGDTNLDGTVNSQDFDELAAKYGSTSGTDWFQGDFNYDGTVNALDFNELAANYGLSVPASAALPDSAAFDAIAMAQPGSLGALVPEPTTLSLLSLSLVALRRRRAAAHS